MHVYSDVFSLLYFVLATSSLIGDLNLSQPFKQILIKYYNTDLKGQALLKKSVRGLHLPNLQRNNFT
jgi:hypothetical protein